MKRNKGSNVRKLTTEMFLILFLSAAAAVGTGIWLYSNRFAAYAWMDSRNLLTDCREEYREWFIEQAPDYKLEPEQQANITGKRYKTEEKLPFVTEHCDLYIGVSIYEKSSGEYVAGYFPRTLDESFFWSDWLWNDSAIMASTESPMEFDAEFADTTAQVQVYSYRSMQIIPAYFMVGIVLALVIILFPVLFFVHHRMRYLGKVRSEVLVMAEGDLEHRITVRGKDEISSLSRELDMLRLALKENIESERRSHEANQELIRAMSHDLRTPLTTLNGYLEILSRSKGDADKYPEYIKRCIKKTEEIRNMSDKMFEYALAFDGQEHVEKQKLSADFLREELEEQTEYLKTQGISVNICWTENRASGYLDGNAFLIKRLCGNLFSNILRYGDHSKTVEIRADMGEERVCVKAGNSIAARQEALGSGVGLKSAERIAVLHGGGLEWKAEEGKFTVTFWLPLVLNDQLC